MRECEETNCATVSRSRFVTSKPVSLGLRDVETDFRIADAVNEGGVSVVLER